MRDNPSSPFLFALSNEFVTIHYETNRPNPHSPNFPPSIPNTPTNINSINCVSRLLSNDIKSVNVPAKKFRILIRCPNPPTPTTRSLYPSNPFRQSHPDHLETVARLFNVDAPNSERSRILEIGSASGGNVIPMAEQLPNSTFLGIDLSAKQVAEGQATIKKIGLSNIELRQANIMDVDASYGQFDYIICHGVFSWVPDVVRKQILQLCQDRLTPQGIAYISYNTYPGWHMREGLRRMMLYHIRSVNEPQRRVEQARALLRFLAGSVGDKDSVYGKFLTSELESLSRHSDGYLIHDHLEENNVPVYFHEFNMLAENHQLVYLAESRVSTMWMGNFPEGVSSTLEVIAPGLIQREQYTDFLLNRSFRQTLLCRKNVSINRAISSNVLREMYISSSLRVQEPEASAETTTEATPAVHFCDNKGVHRLSTRDPILAAALKNLTDSHPGSMKFSDLIQSAVLSVGEIKGGSEGYLAAEKQFAGSIIQLFAKGILELCARPDRFVTEGSARPKVSPVAALHAEAPEHRLTNRRHEVVQCDRFVCHVARFADGTRTKAEIVDCLVKGLDEGWLGLKISANDQTEVSLAAKTKVVSDLTEKALRQLGRSCMLVA